MMIRIRISTVSVAVIVAMCACFVLNGCDKPKLRGSNRPETSARGYMVGSQYIPYPDGVFLGEVDTKDPLQYRVLMIEKGAIKKLAAGTVSPKEKDWDEHRIATRIMKHSGKPSLWISVLHARPLTIDLSAYDVFVFPRTGFQTFDYLHGDQIIYALIAARKEEGDVPLKVSGTRTIEAFKSLTREYPFRIIAIQYGRLDGV